MNRHKILWLTAGLLVFVAWLVLVILSFLRLPPGAVKPSQKPALTQIKRASQLSINAASVQKKNVISSSGSTATTTSVQTTAMCATSSVAQNNYLNPASQQGKTNPALSVLTTQISNSGQTAPVSSLQNTAPGIGKILQ